MVFRPVHVPLAVLACLTVAPLASACYDPECSAAGAVLEFVDPTGEPFAVDEVELVLDGVTMLSTDCDGLGCEAIRHRWTVDPSRADLLEVHYTVGEETATVSVAVEKSTGRCAGARVSEEVTVISR
jgi:hypothetical protein